MKYNIPSFTQTVLTELNRNGYEAYIVGGAVRDLIMGKKPEDWDVATNALPEKVKSIFKDTFDSGIKHGTVTVMIENNQVEVTTYRRESNYSDSRRPDSVEFVESLKEDLNRRDFTMNAIAYNMTEGIKDYYDGMKDINSRIIRCVGNPDQRFKEDALRMLRAVRFSCQLGFQIEKDTLYSLKNNSKLIKNISAERIRDELNKILLSAKPSIGLNILLDTGLLDFILPELVSCKNVNQQNPHHVYDVYEHILESIDRIKPELDLRLTMLLHDLGKPQTKTIDKSGIGHFYGHDLEGAKIAETILKRLRYDNKTIKKITALVRWHDYRISPEKSSIKKAAAKIGPEYFEYYFDIRKADIMAQNSALAEEKLKNLAEVQQLYNEIIRNKEPFIIKDLKINGDDLKKLGIKEGLRIKTILDFLLKEVQKNPSLNEKDKLAELASDFSINTETKM